MENHLSQQKPSIYGLTLFSMNLLTNKLSVLFEPVILKFLEKNDFPLWVIKQIFAEEDQKNKQQNIEDNDSKVINTESGNKRHRLVLTYQGK